MIKFKFSLLGLCLCIGLLLGVCPTWAAEVPVFIEIPRAQSELVIDGVADEGEYQVAYTMDKANAEAWVGTLDRQSRVTWRFAWDEVGFYVCVTAQDSTPVYRDDTTHWVGADCVEFGLNPGYFLNKDDDKGVFFSMGATADGRVIVYRHNYDEKLVTANITGKSTGHTAGSTAYTIEVCIPWSLILIEADCTKTDTHLDATGLVVDEMLAMGMVMAHIDASDDTTIGVAYKFKGTDFVTGQYLAGRLAGAKADETEAETEAYEPTPDETTTEVVTEVETLPPLTIQTQENTSAETQGDATSAPTQETPDTGCASVALAWSWLPLLGAGWLICSKKREMT